MTSPDDRNAAFVMDFINNEELHELIDYISYCLYPTHNYIQDLVIDSIVDYYIKKVNLYKLLFGVYLAVVVLMIVLSVIIIFKKLKVELLEITNLLILLPFSDLLDSDRHKIENLILK